MPPRSPSAGLLLHRSAPGTSDSGPEGVEVLIGHLGGPLWSRREARAWSIPKGEVEAGESLEDAARREFTEELGLPVPGGETVALGSVRQGGGKVVTAWALHVAGPADFDVASVVVGTTTIEWPPRSGNQLTIPELDRVEWTPLPAARGRVVAAQEGFLDRLLDVLEERSRAQA